MDRLESTYHFKQNYFKPWVFRQNHRANDLQLQHRAPVGSHDGIFGHQVIGFGHLGPNTTECLRKNPRMLGNHQWFHQWFAKLFFSTMIFGENHPWSPKKGGNSGKIMWKSPYRRNLEVFSWENHRTLNGSLRVERLSGDSDFRAEKSDGRCWSASKIRNSTKNFWFPPNPVISSLNFHIFSLYQDCHGMDIPTSLDPKR